MLKSIFIAVFSLLLLSACDSGKPAMNESMYLEYKSGAGIACKIDFSKIKPGVYNVKFTPNPCGLQPAEFKNSEKDKVNSKLQPISGPKIITWGDGVNLWIPADKRKSGAHWNYNGAFAVSRVEKWNGWNCAIVTATVGALQSWWYYDVKSGFLVGVERKMKFVDNKRTVIYKLSDSDMDIMP